MPCGAAGRFHSNMQDTTEYPGVSLQIMLGRLAVAGEAMPGIYHVQDTVTGKILPVVVQPPIGPAKRLAKFWLCTPNWVKAGVACAAALLLAGGLGLAQRLHSTANPTTLPLAAPGASSGTVKLVDAPYQQQPDEAPGSAVAVAPESAPVPEVVPASAPSAAELQVVAAPAASAIPTNLPPAKTETVRTSVKAKMPAAPALAAKGREESGPVVVFNEPGPHPAAAPAPVVTQAQSGKALQATPPPAALAAPAPRMSPSTDSGQIRLLAIKDANTIVVNVPGNVMPVQVRPGAKLSNGRTIVKADPAKGVVQLDNGSTLVLE
jgi:hypothetical protein